MITCANIASDSGLFYFVNGQGQLQVVLRSIMNQVDHEKSRLEEQASRIFCRWYSRVFNKKMTFVHLLEELALLDQSTDIQSRLLKALNRILYNKALKHYDSAHPWLVIRNSHPAWEAEDIRHHCAQIHLSTSHPFEQIWIIGDWEGISGVVNLYP